MEALAERLNISVSAAVRSLIEGRMASDDYRFDMLTERLEWMEQIHEYYFAELRERLGPLGAAGPLLNTTVDANRNIPAPLDVAMTRWRAG